MTFNTFDIQSHWGRFAERGSDRDQEDGGMGGWMDGWNDLTPAPSAFQLAVFYRFCVWILSANFIIPTSC